MKTTQSRRKKDSTPREIAVTFNRQAQSKIQTPPRAVSEQAIRERAYYLFLERGAVGGDALQDWLRAEQELRAAARAGGGGFA